MGSDKAENETGHRVIFSRVYIFSLFSALLLAGTVSVFPQTTEQLDYYSAQIESGTVEAKRDVLGMLRRFETESASRTAAPALNDLSAIVRATAVGAVAYMPKNEAAAHVEPLLRDPSDFVRREAASALGTIAYPVSADPLVQTLSNDDDSEVRAAAAAALGLIGNTTALESLAKILESKPKSSRSFLRRSAARSIGQIAERSKKESISNSTPESFLPDKFKSGYEKPVSELPARPVFKRAAAALEKVLSNRKETNDTRREAAFALGEIGDDSSIPLLRQYVNDTDYYLAEICREALIKLTSK